MHVSVCVHLCVRGCMWVSECVCVCVCVCVCTFVCMRVPSRSHRIYCHTLGHKHKPSQLRQTHFNTSGKRLSYSNSTSVPALPSITLTKCPSVPVAVQGAGVAGLQQTADS